jgi:uncharacterized membrane protein YfcA
MMRGILDSIAMRLDEARDLSRYLTGLLIFLGLLGTFWGLIETVGSVGKVVETLKPGGDSASVFETLREGLAAPLSGMGIAFSSSLFGLAGQMVKNGPGLFGQALSAALPLLLAVVIGGQIGSLLAARLLPPQWIRWLTAALVLVVGVRLLVGV